MKKCWIILCIVALALSCFCGCVVKEVSDTAGDITVYTKKDTVAQNKVTLSAEDCAKIRGFIEKADISEGVVCQCDDAYFFMIDGIEYHCPDDASHLTDYKNKKSNSFDDETTNYMRGILMSYPALGFVYEAGENNE